MKKIPAKGLRWFARLAKEESHGSLECPNCKETDLGFCFHIMKLLCAYCGHTWKVHICPSDGPKIWKKARAGT